MIAGTNDIRIDNDDGPGFDVKIRLGKLDDLPFVRNSWTLGMETQYPNMHALDFRKRFHEFLTGLIEKSTVLIAHLDDDEDEILSYLVYTSFRDMLVIHYAYTKEDARKQGIVSDLMKFANVNDYPVVFTHASRNPNRMKKFCMKYIFDPGVLQLL